MVYYPDALTVEAANDRFDHMVAVCETVPFGKQPVIELSSGNTVGYTGVDYIDFEGRSWLEWGYRLVRESRGRGYATEASQALLSEHLAPRVARRRIRVTQSPSGPSANQD